jgi:dihydrofolate synthase/folylpolyglutamate synthase
VPNALVAVRLLEELERQLPVTPASIVAGLRDVRWPGRLQMIEVPGGHRVLLDAAHNPAGAWALASYLKREFPEPLPIVFGALRDKDVSLMLKALLPAASTMVMTQPDSPRAHTADELAAIAQKLSPRTKIEVQPDPARALAQAWTHCPVVCAAGSLFLIGNLLAGLGPDVRDL